MNIKIFITGTDTNVGKTYVTKQLLCEATKMGLRTLGIKPVASGCERRNGTLRNQDALDLQSNSSIQLPYEKINPFAFEAPIAPHLAAATENIKLSVDVIYHAIQEAFNHSSDLCLIEGAGGWLVPLNEDETMTDLVKRLHIPVILVVGIRLGCINHSLLTVKAMEQENIPIIGWIANCLEADTDHSIKIINSLKSLLRTPLLSVFPFTN
jgi:dethiobiotin synthetase